jgi:hypothetical protein
MNESSMQRGRFPWRVATDDRAQIRIMDASNRVVMHLLVDDIAIAERIVRFMNAEAEALKAQGRERWLHERPI